MSQKPTEAGSLPKRWSARRKSEVVLRLPRGENLGELSREIKVSAPELERWRRLLAVEPTITNVRAPQLVECEAR